MYVAKNLLGAQVGFQVDKTAWDKRRVNHWEHKYGIIGMHQKVNCRIRNGIT